MEQSTALDLQAFMTLGFYLLVGIYCIFSAIIYYHWKTYAMNARAIRLTLLSYFASTVPLLGIMGFATLGI